MHSLLSFHTKSCFSLPALWRWCCPFTNKEWQQPSTTDASWLPSKVSYQRFQTSIPSSCWKSVPVQVAQRRASCPSLKRDAGSTSSRMSLQSSSVKHVLGLRSTDFSRRPCSTSMPTRACRGSHCKSTTCWSPQIVCMPHLSFAIRYATAMHCSARAECLWSMKLFRTPRSTRSRSA